MELNGFLEELEYLVNIDSGSDCLVGLSRVADFFAGKFTEMGWITEKFDFAPDAGTCVIAVNRKAEHYDLMMIGHIDTVFSAGTCAERPFRIEDGKAYGPGTADMKAGSLLMYHILKDLPKEINDKLNIVAVFNPDEEIGSHFSRKAYSDYAKISDYTYVYESCGSGDYSRCAVRKGGSFARVSFKGIAGHCGYMFSNGSRSAISEMARWIVKLENELISRERNTTVNIGIVNGGTKSNVVAENANMRVDIRYSIPGEKERAQAVFDELMSSAKKNGIEVELKLTTKPALNPTNEGWEYIRHLEKLFRNNGMEFKLRERGGFSDANIIAPLGPVCIDGMGPSGDGSHSDREYLEIDSIMPSYKYSNIMIKDLADRKEQK